MQWNAKIRIICQVQFMLFFPYFRGYAIMNPINNSEVGFYASSVRWMGSRLETKRKRLCACLTIYYPHPLLQMSAAHVWSELDIYNSNEQGAV